MTLLRLFCCGDRFAVKAATSLSGFLLLHQPKVYRPGKRGEFSLGRKNKNGCSRPHVNKYINQKGRLLRKQRTARTEKFAQKEALRQDTQQQNSPQQMVQRFEIWFAELGDHFGSSVQSGSRPVLVISNDVANRFSSTLTVIPLTTVQKKLGLPTHIQIAETDCKMLNSHVYLRNSVALAEQVTTIDKKALQNKLGCLTSDAKQRKVEQAIAVFPTDTLHSGLSSSIGKAAAVEFLKEID